MEGTRVAAGACAFVPTVTDAIDLNELGLSEPAQVGGDTSPLDLVPGSEPLGEVIVPGEAVAPSGYRLVGKLGEGGMGVVYEAIQLSLDRRVAIKFLREGLLGLDREDQFFGEARAMARLRHPNVVQVYDAGSVAGRPYLVMDLVSGLPFLELAGKDGHDIPLRRAFELVAEAAAGVDYCNRQGLVHCDINPRNLMVDERGNAYVMDFGIARALGTVSRDAVRDYGTPAYLAPERLVPGAAVDARTDVYSLGAVLYYLVTGEHPFSGKNLRVVLRKVQESVPRPPRELNPRLSLDAETIIQRAMEKDPAARYATVQELRDEIERYLKGEAIVARRIGWHRLAARYFVAHRAAILILGVALVGFGFGAAEVWRLWGVTSQLMAEQEHHDQTIARLRSELAAAEATSQSQAKLDEDEIVTLRSKVELLNQDYERMRLEYIAQSQRLGAILAQKDALLVEREQLLARREEAQRLAEERLAKLAATSDEARAVQAELANARATISQQETALHARGAEIEERSLALVAALQAQEQAVASAQRLVEEEIERETTALVRMLDDPNPRTCVLAIDKLAKRADPRLLPKLIDLATDARRRSAEVRSAALAAVAAYPDRAPLVHLASQVVRDPDASVRRALITILRRDLDDATAKIVAILVDDPDRDVALAAIDTLVTGGRREATSALVRRLREPERVSEAAAAIRGLARLAEGEGSVATEILPMAESHELELRLAAAEALAAFPTSPVVRKLEWLSGDASVRVRTQAITSLVAISRLRDRGDEVVLEALEALPKFLLDADRSVATRANDALRTATGGDAGWRFDSDQSAKRKAMRRWATLIKA